MAKASSKRTRRSVPTRRLPSDVVRSLNSLRPPFDGWVARSIWNFENGYADLFTLRLMADLAVLLQEWQRRLAFEMSKRLFDIVFASLAILISAPLMLVIALAIWFESGRPILFVQMRAGRFGVPFWMLKFRTMRAAPSQFLPPMQKPTGDSPHLSRVGIFLRNHKLDELPQLFNVLKGDMSLVGPRPLSLNDSSAIPQNQTIRFAVRPGLTGLWQVTASNDAPSSVKVALDCEYVLRRGWAMDARLLLGTPRVLVLGESRHNRRFPGINDEKKAA